MRFPNIGHLHAQCAKSDEKYPNGFVCDLCDLSGKPSVLLFVEHGHSSDGRPGPFSNLQRESNESESLADHLVEIAQILYVRDPPFRTYAVTRVRLLRPTCRD